ncbi:MAG: chalcone isomerase family protein [Alphaproteobacteria bacterium]
MLRIFSVLAVFLFLAASPSGGCATEVAGLSIPDQVRLHHDVTPLQLNGAGVRYKLFFKIYVGALYLPAPQHTTATVLALPGPKRVSMHFLYKEVSQEKLADGWRDGFKNNLTADELPPLRDRLTRFNSLFRTVRRGDVIELDFLPDGTTEVWINDALQGQVRGGDFQRALLLIWLGDDPADEDLKQAMLKRQPEEEE